MLDSARILARILIIFGQREQKIKPKIFCARNLLEKKFYNYFCAENCSKTAGFSAAVRFE